MKGTKTMRALMMLAALLPAAPAMAGEQDFVLKDGDGQQLVAANCQICHSLDYIEMNSPFLDEKHWQATVTKMIDRYGAPIPPENVPAIVSYLSKNYGP
jgi:mono/diheme cytochrome c family protein